MEKKMMKDELLNGRYRILKVLGEGGMSTVYLAENIKLGSLWAIKKINKASNSKFDLLAEPNILKKLNHFALPRIFDIIEDDKSIYIIEDYIEGIPLNKKLLRCGKIAEETVSMWALQICDVLSYLHTLKPNPIIYRDMKPSNIILTGEGLIKLIDFGIAREYKTESLLDTTYIGTRGYAAPEQYGTAQTDIRSDIYSLGVTLYHLLTGNSPKEPNFEIKPIREIDNSLTKGMEFIIEKCTKTDPDQRYQSIEELYHDLQNLNRTPNNHSKKSIVKKLKVISMVLLILFFSYMTYVGFGDIIEFFSR